MSTTLNDKIEQIKDARDDIKQAIYNKTGETQSDDIRTYANKISNIDTVNNEDKTIVENGTYTAGQDYTGFGEVVVNVPQGPDTSDATATANDIINPKTAYVNRQKITGAILPSYDYNNIVPEDLDEINFGSMPVEIDRENGYALYVASNTIKVKKINQDKSLTEIISIAPTDLSSSASNIYNATFVIIEGLIRIVTNGYNDKKIYLLEYDLETHEQITKTSISHNSYTSWGANAVAYKFSPINPNEFIAYATSSSYASIYYYTINSSKTMTLANTKTAGNYGISSGKLRAYFSNDGKYLYCYASYVYTGNRYAPYYFNYIFSVSTGGVLTQIVSSSNEISYGSYNGGAYYMLDNGLVYEAWASTPAVYKISGTSLVKLYTTSIRISDHSQTSSTMFDTSSNFLCAMGNYLIFRYSGNVKIYKVTEQALTLYKTVSADKLLVSYNKSISYGTSPSFGGLILNPENAKLIGLTRNGFNYVDTSDANSTSSDVLLNKTAYVNGNKLTGTMPNNGALNITPSTSQQSIPAGYTSGGTVSAVTSSIDENITAENIKKDVSILGVTGTLEKGIDTSDATATSDDILEGKTAYVNGTKITGTYNNTSSSDILYNPSAYLMVMDPENIRYINNQVKFEVNNNPYGVPAGKIKDIFKTLKYLYEKGLYSDLWSNYDYVWYISRSHSGNCLTDANNNSFYVGICPIPLYIDDMNIEETEEEMEMGMDLRSINFGDYYTLYWGLRDSMDSSIVVSSDYGLDNYERHYYANKNSGYSLFSNKVFAKVGYTSGILTSMTTPGQSGGNFYFGYTGSDWKGMNTLSSQLQYAVLPPISLKDNIDTYISNNWYQDIEETAENMIALKKTLFEQMLPIVILRDNDYIKLNESIVASNNPSSYLEATGNIHLSNKKFYQS